MWFESGWYFCNISNSGWFWKRLSRKNVLNNHFLKSLQKLHFAIFTGKHQKFCNFTEKHLCWGLILINLQALRPTTLFKKDFITGVSCEYYYIYTNTNSFFYGTLRLLLLLVWWSSCSVTDSICRSSLLNQKHKCGMVSTKKVSRSVQSMLFTRD